MRRIVLLFLVLVLNMLFFNSTFAKNRKCGKRIRVCRDTVMFASEYNPIIEKNIQLEKRVESQKGAIKGLRDSLGNGIESFLKIKDVSIFTYNFREYDPNELPACVQDYYALIMNIHLLYLQLTEIDNLKVSQIDKLNTGLENALTTINVVNSFVTIERHKVTDYLTEEQKQFFRDLVDKYNKISIH